MFQLFLGQLIGGGDTWRSKLYTETGSRLRVQVWTGTWTPCHEGNGLALLVPGVQVKRVFRGIQLGYIDSRIVVVVTL